MISLAIRTDSPTTHLVLLEDGEVLTELHWESGRGLAKDLLRKIVALCDDASVSVESVGAIICYEGPGSFTGLRIGITVGNTIAYANGAPIVGTTGDSWVEQGLQKILKGDNDTLVIPSYGADAHITL